MKYLNALNKISGLGPQKMRCLLAFFQNDENIWSADQKSLLESGIGEKLSQKIETERKKINPDEEWEKLEKEKIKMVVWTSPEYPSLLKEIHHPPYILYVKGNFDDFNFSPALSIVGSRKYTAYGSRAAQSLSKELSSAGITVVSGMALGIDSFAHRGALDGGGKTIAVLGNGLDDKNIYPRNNFNLSREILERGCLLSEYPPGTEAGALTFPARNRLIAGMTLGTLVVEAGEKSGALITAQMALDYNREVMAVPGSIFSPESIGSNQLVKKGARVITGLWDILEGLGIESQKNKLEKKPKIPSSETEKKLLEVISSDPIHIDNLGKISKLETAELSAALSLMEIKGWIKNIGGQNYIQL